ncbi:phosphoglycerate mutase family protein [Phanerochaete sordida]|uniref:Phosphoglycerate mutase family protein n=1 Tax=Phanerochaete sordida TaxID=48140 RepID=A0A9P3L7Q1_9APHY|nr:phosphoglycerate mutase family protein [Phanerochaete sordida]
MYSSFTALTWIVLLATSVWRVAAEDDPTFKNTVYLIRNGETNTKKFGSGLTQTGILRSQCLPSVFGPNTAQTVGYILAEPPLKKTNVSDAVDTVIPLAESLGIPIDISCGHDDKDCVGDALSAFALKNTTASMLVVWDSDLLPDIAETLGANDVNDWPKGRFDLIWTIQKNKIRSRASEGCPGLDNVVPA